MFGSMTAEEYAADVLSTYMFFERLRSARNEWTPEMIENQRRLLIEDFNKNIKLQPIHVESQSVEIIDTFVEPDLTTLFRPCGVYYSDSDRYEILTRDSATVVHHVPGSDVYLLKDMETGEIVGMGVEFAKTTFK